MSSRLPESIDPWQLCDRRQIVAGHASLADFPRLVPLLANADGDVEFRLEFGRDPEGRATVVCQAACVVQLTCQRCLDVVDFSLRCESTVAIVTGLEESGRLPDGLEPLMVETETMAPSELIEEELLLALPAVPRHAKEECGGEHREDLVQEKRENPFQVLAALKSGKREH